MAIEQSLTMNVLAHSMIFCSVRQVLDANTCPACGVSLSTTFTQEL